MPWRPWRQVFAFAAVVMATDSSDISGNNTDCYATDDTVYNSTSCSTYDGQCCEFYCLTSTECTAYCGSECADGAGALCAFTLLTKLQSVCESLEDGGARRNLRRMAHTELRSSVSQAGCDDHAYCEYCLPHAMCVHALQDLAQKVLSTDEYDNLIFKGAAPLALVLVGHLDELCGALEEDETDPKTLAKTYTLGTLTSGTKQILAPGSAAGLMVMVAGFIAVSAVVRTIRRRRVGRNNEGTSLYQGRGAQYGS